MSRPLPPLSALRAFEAAARHLSLTRAAEELAVTPAALSHQVRGLEEFLGLKLFERRSRGIAMTDAGQALYPGLHGGFAQIRQAVDALERVNDDRVLVISAPPGFTAKWLAPRLYRFMVANTEIDARISASLAFANFTTDGVDVAIRNLRLGQHRDPDLVIDLIVELSLVPVCAPRLVEETGLSAPQDLARLPLIHDDSLFGRAELPTWEDWFAAAGVTGVDVSRGLRFNSADHALDATVEGAGVLLAHNALAHDDIRTGRLVIPFDLALPTGRAFHFVCPRGSETRDKVAAFRAWLGEEAALAQKTDVVEAGRQARGAARTPA